MNIYTDSTTPIQPDRHSQQLIASSATPMHIIHELMGCLFAMIKDIRLTRPARAAIAAVLAFSATPLLAQEVAPPAAAPVAPPQIAPVMDAPASVASAPVMAPTQPVVQSTPSVEERKAEAIAQAEAADAEAAPVPVRREQQRPAARAVASKPAPANSVAATPAPAPAPVEVVPVDPAPVAPNMAVSIMAEPATMTPPANNEAVQATDSGEALTWGLAGGALLLIGAAGAMAMRRRRNRAGDAAYSADEGVSLHTGVVSAATATETGHEPLTADAPHGSLAAMVDALPSQANPFLTRSNRLRRAHFLLAQQAGVTTGARTEAATAAPQAAPVERPQIVYSFGKDGARRNGLIPRTR